MNVSVFGLGYVGSVTAACLASFGHKVVGVDVNPDKVEATNIGRSLIVERGLEELIYQGVRNGNLRATHDAASAIAQSDVAIICVGTPSDTNGNLDFRHLDRVFMQFGQVLRKETRYKVIAVRSTMLPGTLAERLVPILRQQSGKQAGEDFGAAINPEFLREGSAIDDFKNPPFTLIGAIDNLAAHMLTELYSTIAAPVFRTSPDTACMVKYASNAFHGLKIAFANEIGQICKKLSMDGTEVMEIFCQDTRLNISTRYLRPGFAFGGSCIPKDLRALQYLARHNDLCIPVIESILPSNRLLSQAVADRILSDQRKNVGIIGLAFKAGTDDLRESPMVELAETLCGKGLKVRIYDNNVFLSKLMGGNKAFIEQGLPHISNMMSNSIEELVECSDVIVVGHDLQDGGEKLFNLLRPEQLLIDFVRITTNRSHPAAYEGICW